VAAFIAWLARKCLRLLSPRTRTRGPSDTSNPVLEQGKSCNRSASHKPCVFNGSSELGCRTVPKRLRNIFILCKTIQHVDSKRKAIVVSCDKRSYCSEKPVSGHDAIRVENGEIRLTGGTLGYYVPFYFAPGSSMFCAIYYGRVDGYPRAKVKFSIWCLRLCSYTIAAWSLEY
jgi:hypothetical protein